MASYILPGLTPQEATRICMDECRAMCCRGPLVLRLTKDEVQPFKAQAARLGAEPGGWGGARWEWLGPLRGP